MLDLNKKIRLDETNEFRKAGITHKTIRIDKNGGIKESMSFPAFNMCDFVQQTWEESDLFQVLNERILLIYIRRTA